MSISLIPDQLCRVYGDVTASWLQQRGIRLLLCDLDFTLAPKSILRPDAAVFAWIESMKAAGITVMILSNNRSSKRVELFCRELGIAYVGHAGKPAPRGYRQAMAKVGVTERETAMLGDKLLTDVLGAKRSGVLSLMVEPAGGPRTAWQKVLHALQAPFKKLAKGEIR
ncbi:MAG: YqeG family HAD IIIA-type phosphatase [Clostridiales bacterium]|nr:YqeG family HAD IIIA-type phosphatase [Candidatus Cacconaster stercorequi]